MTFKVTITLNSVESEKDLAYQLARTQEMIFANFPAGYVASGPLRMDGKTIGHAEMERIEDDQ